MKGSKKDRRKVDSGKDGEERIVRDEEIPAVDRAAAITVVIADLEDELSETRPGNSTRRDLLRLSVAELRNRRDSLIPQACREHAVESFAEVSDDTNPEAARRRLAESTRASEYEDLLREECGARAGKIPARDDLTVSLIAVLIAGVLCTIAADLLENPWMGVLGRFVFLGAGFGLIVWISSELAIGDGSRR